MNKLIPIGIIIVIVGVISVLVIDQFIIVSTYESMKRQCEEEFLNLTTEFTEIDVKRDVCISKAKQWKVEQYSKYGIIP